MNLKFETFGVNFVEKRGKITAENIATPIHICRDMSNLFDYTNCNQKIWMDIFCKTGNTLQALKEHSVNKENITAICDNKQSQMLVCRKLYGKILPEVEVEITVKSLEAYTVTRRGQVYWISSWQDIVKNNYQDAYNIIKFVILREMEKTMTLEWTSEDNFQINNIIMNPPYNNDIYIDFVTLAKNIATDGVVPITPAKFQAKGGEKNEAFRRDVVPYISDIVMYKDSTDVFNIEEWGGVCYYLVDSIKHSDKHVTNICSKSAALSSDAEIHSEDTLMIVPNKIKSILDKCSIGDRLSDKTYFSRFTYTSEQERGHKPVAGMNNIPIVQGTKYTGGYLLETELKTTDNLSKYKVITSCMWGNGNAMFDKTNKIIGVTNMSIVKPDEVPKGSFIILKYFDTEDECNSFISYMYCKLNAFLIYNGLVGATLNKEFWRFVPDPGAFDHIFTDEELYQKYGLTEEEIAIIENVIKERK